MMSITLRDFAERAGAQIVGASGTARILTFALDNRQATPGCLFVAIRGNKIDGHAFCAEAVCDGAIACLVERPVEGPHLLVDSVMAALARFASSVRAEFKGPVVGITGSNGKTSTKEFLAAALSCSGPVLKNRGNRNTEWTAPLLWGELEPDHWCVVTEMAMRGAGQIAHLASFARPTVGIVTNIGTSHLEMVGTREGIARAKSELLEALPESGVAILWKQDPYLDTLVRACPCAYRTFGFTNDADLELVGYRADTFTSATLIGRVGHESFEVRLPVVGRHQALNAGAALLAATLLGVSLQDAAKALEKAELPPMRMEIVPLGDATVLMDTYNASPDSTEAAVRTLAELPCKGRRLAIIGEMRELGDYAESGHRRVGRAIAECQLDGVLFFGEQASWAADEALAVGYPPNSVFARTNDLNDVRSFLSGLRAGDLVLVKGSRALELEKAVPGEGVTH